MKTLIEKLEKCRASLQAHTRRGGTRSSLRGIQLELRYDDLKEEALSIDRVWYDFCKKYEMDSSHSGYDFFA